MRSLASFFIIAYFLGGCSDPGPLRSRAVSNTIVPLEIDGTTIFVPAAWDGGRPWDARPWRNGVLVGIGGWISFHPHIPALSLIDQENERPKDGVYRASSKGQRVDPRDPYFTLSVTFEFPLPPEKNSWWDKSKDNRIYPFSFDRLRISYRAPDERQMPYLTLLNNLDPNDGEDLGDGWRTVSREYSSRTVWFRFDAVDWRARGGTLPPRLASSDSRSGSIWYHYLPLSPRGWSVDFNTQRLPLSRWRAKYSTAETLYDWLRTSPAKRKSRSAFRVVGGSAGSADTIATIVSNVRFGSKADLPSAKSLKTLSM